MIEIFGDLFEQTNYDAIVITTNGELRKNGNAVMGRGVAYTAKRKWPGLEKALGHQLRLYGNICRIIMSHKFNSPKPVIAFPVKHKGTQPADIRLIKRSLSELVLVAKNNPDWTRIILPRPGCGTGGLHWQHDGVDALCALSLDNRFIIINNEPELEETE